MGVVGNLQARFGDPIAAANSDDWLMFDISAIEPAGPTASRNFIYQPFIQADPLTVHPRESELADYWWWTRDARATFTITPIREESPITRIRGSVTAPKCGPRPITLKVESQGRVHQTSLVAIEEQLTTFDVVLPEPSTLPVRLEMLAPGQGCSSDEPGPQHFAKLSNLRTYVDLTMTE